MVESHHDFADVDIPVVGAQALLPHDLRDTGSMAASFWAYHWRDEDDDEVDVDVEVEEVEDEVEAEAGTEVEADIQIVTIVGMPAAEEELVAPYSPVLWGHMRVFLYGLEDQAELAQELEQVVVYNPCLELMCALEDQELAPAGMSTDFVLVDFEGDYVNNHVQVDQGIEKSVEAQNVVDDEPEHNLSCLLLIHLSKVKS